jgi:hypothetical protein
MSLSKYGRLGLCLVSLLGLMSLFSVSAFASGPPIVTAGAASELTLNTATANGTVDKNGATSASVKIEYGQSKLYGQSVALANVTASGAVAVSEILAGLTPLTTYHYRISATNSYGTTVSEDVQFEMLLQWKVDGKPLSAFSNPVKYHGQGGSWGLTGEGLLGSKAIKVTCDPSYVEGGAEGSLGVSYRFPYTNCKFFVNGVKNGACVPVLPTLVLNAVLQPPSGQVIEMAEGECAVTNSLPLPSGFRVGPLSEALVQNTTLTGKAGWMTYTIANPGYRLHSPNNEFKWGIS